MLDDQHSPTTFQAAIKSIEALFQQPELHSVDAQQAIIQILELMPLASSEDITRAMTELASLIDDLSLDRAAFLALGCGAMVEQGAPSAPLSNAIITRSHEALASFVPGDPRSDQIVSMLLNALLAIGMRLQAVRQRLAADQFLIEVCQRWREENASIDCLHFLLKVLDDEPILVFHPETGRGYRVIINGIGKNFELHTLLADAVLGDPAEGRIPGERPDPRVMAAASDGPFPIPGEEEDASFPSASSPLNLWNWTGIRPDGKVPTEQRESLSQSQHFIWNEGIPADIVPFEGQRIILLGPAPYARSWNAGRFFPGMKAELRVVEVLSPTEVQLWLQQLVKAAHHL